ncbi:arginine deiminase family protein [Paraglaciecola sp.]|uniref:arginine deiminase family protein n=1 Tax=Paraglaciecola sp. TaxID=1920173 RepID=UPI00273D9608|nr:arginine deiminase family protein [Paraglaciecola sp.]MDP5031756.1 arginine deiminase family protein [Paraglaciecola sp.]
MFSHAIARKPCRSMVKGITSAKRGKPNFEIACEQHDDYILALQECGLSVTVLDALEAFPDSCFVEDVALFTPIGAILTHPGTPSRQGEVKFIAEVVNQFYPYPDIIDAPGHLEAGDIMMVGGHFYIGLSGRTNRQGAQQLIHLLAKQGLSGSMVNMSGLPHLKRSLSYLENNNLLTFGEMHHHADFSDYNRIEMSANERYAASSVWINGTVLVPKGFPEALATIQSLGYASREVAMSEFQKLDGGLSGLSLRF